MEASRDSEIGVFLDADFSDDPNLIRSCRAIRNDTADLVIGSRTREIASPIVTAARRFGIFGLHADSPPF
jgi:hypothetical protein